MPRSATEDDISRIYEETMDDLYGFISRRCDGRRDLAEDVTQETWLRAIRVWRADGLPERPLAWLTTVGARLLIDHYRRARADELNADEVDAIEDDRSARDDPPDSQSMVRRALGRLPSAQHRLLRAFHFDRQPVAEIASSSGLSERAVEGRLRRAREKLRHEIESDLEREGEDT
jgi:RNA polymerase sigma-70 factor (ECF subfamily)